jgi:hypothetical protein
MQRWYRFCSLICVPNNVSMERMEVEGSGVSNTDVDERGIY